MSDYLGFPNMPNIPNPSEWKHADTAKTWAEKANKAEAHVEAMVELFDDSIDNMAARLNDVNDRLEEVTIELNEAEEEIATSLADAHAAATAAQTASTAAQTAATNASAAVSTVTTAATAATTAATNSSNSAAQASTSATNASASEDAAEESAESSAASAAESAASAAEAAASAASMTDAVEQCAASAASALDYATAALASENAAATSSTNAGTYATAANTSKNEAANYSSSANTSKLAAAVSATNAATSETNAATSASSASTSATTATTAASTATTAKDLAETAATTATTKATEAAASATAADSSETAAQGYSESAQNYATAAANSAAQAAQSAATFDATEYANPTAQTGYADNGIGRNKKRVDDLTSDLGYVKRSVTPSSQEVSSFNCVYKYDRNNSSVSVKIPGSFVNSNLNIVHGTDTIITLTTSIPVVPQNYKNCAFLIHNFNPDNAVEFKYKSTVDSEYRQASSTDFVVIEAKDVYPKYSVDGVRAEDFPSGQADKYKSYYFIWLKDYNINELYISFSSNYIETTAEKVMELAGPISLGVCTITTAPNPKPAYYLGSKASSIDFGTGLVKRDHRVRVHINLPYAKNTSYCEANALGLGFSGANFCPDSLVQYGRYNRYSGFNPYRYYGNPYYKRDGNVDTSYIGNNTYNNLSQIGSNTGHIRSYNTRLKTTCLGREHSGWASWIVPGILGSNDLSGNQPFGNANIVSFGIPYMKTYVPISKDLTEDTVSKIDALDEELNDSTKALNIYNKLCRYNQQFNNSSSVTANKNYMMYCYPSMLTECTTASAQTNITNPYTAFYAGMNFRVTRGATTNTPTTDIKSAKGISNGNLLYIDNSKLWSYNDDRSVRYTNNWHSNPILPGSYNTYSTYYDHNEPSILDNEGAYTYTLGIRYFDATAQEWRVFSPGDNCSYGYDGTHWNYREFLWVDLDKPVTFIVGGLQSDITSTAYKINWSEFLAATSMYGVSNLVYGKHYMPRSTAFENSPVSDHYGDGDSSSVNDLIHVETPNFDNYTSYSKWRRFTLMTVDYSSSPLGEYDTVYCADSAYNPDNDRGITKFSCVYSASPYIGTSLISDTTKTTAVKDSFIAPMNYSRISPNTTANTANPLDSNMYENKLLVAYDKSFGPNITESYYGPNTDHAVYGHTAYHIRIAKYE